MKHVLISILLSVILCTLPTVSQAQAIGDDTADEQALKELEKTLNDPKARQEFTRGKADAEKTQSYFEKFPSYAQQELNEIVMMIMRESKMGAQKHVDAYGQGGAEKAHASFSPQVKARIEALQKRLSADPKFNSPENLKMMKSFMPSLSAAGS